MNLEEFDVLKMNSEMKLFAYVDESETIAEIGGIKEEAPNETKTYHIISLHTKTLTSKSSTFTPTLAFTWGQSYFVPSSQSSTQDLKVMKTNKRKLATCNSNSFFK
eukprot:TRINITY_DN4179_c0_g1_i1.p3 TRINITY_DN4179_c0_g1~~TRINITY_DN4179_c0_g1_i1.p3  ORF type:complete len:106 (+),score=26.77 TRINITY_DN4179_c0_g1_i1:849-1166(+)